LLSGIGLAIAKELAKAGASIVLNGFGDPAEIEKIRKDLETLYHDGKKDHVIYVPADLSKVSAIPALKTYRTHQNLISYLAPRDRKYGGYHLSKVRQDRHPRQQRW